MKERNTGRTLNIWMALLHAMPGGLKTGRLNENYVRACLNIRNSIGVARIFRGWVRPEVDPGFLVRGTMEGPKAPSEAL